MNDRFWPLALAVIVTIAPLGSLQAASATYFSTNAFPNLIFSNPACITAPPGETNRLFIGEKHGRIIVITNLANPTRTTFLDISERVSIVNISESADLNSEQGLLGVAFHPGYATNHFFYVFYMGQATNGTFGLHDILARFRTSLTDPNQADPSSETRLIVQYDRASNHNGGDLHFGPDGYLYVGLGDEGNEYNTFHDAQHIDQNFFSGILRLDVDQRPGSLAPNASAVFAATLNYSVPPDNPFIGATTFDGVTVNSNQVRTEFWAVGLRNPWRFSFDSVTGILYCGDVGQDQYEEVDIIHRGGNYGWATYEGIHTPPSGVATAGQPVPQNAIFPMAIFPHRSLTGNTNGPTTGNCVIGGVVYRGERFPQLSGSYVFGDYISGNFWSLRYDGTNATAPQRLFVDAGVSGFGTDPSNGDVLYLDLQNGNNSVIKRIISTNGAPVLRVDSVTSTNLILRGTGGNPGAPISVLTSATVDLPLLNWSILGTTNFDTTGNVSFTNAVNQLVPSRFYILH